MTDIDKRALDSMSVAPEDPATDREASNTGGQGDAASDASIDQRLKDNPESSEARLDAGLDESMDASDPISATQPVHSTEPAPSSGYDEEAERARQE